MHSRINLAPTLFPIILAGFLAGMTYWLDLASRPLTFDNDGKSRHDPDYIVENFEARRFDPDGALQHTLRAQSMRHYPDDDTTVILSPQLMYHTLPTTIATSREARLDSKGKHVELVDAVRVSRAGQNGAPATVLTTTRLEIIPDDEIAWSKSPVTISQGESSISGSGLQANQKTATYVLEGPVHGTFLRSMASTKAEAKRPAASTKPVPKSRSKPKSRPKPKT